MVAETHGKPKGSKSKMNGQPNGGSGSTSRSSRARRKSKGTTAGWGVDKALKLLVWYSIVTLAFRCPQTRIELTDTSPKICKPAIQAREFVLPYTRPYYDQYLGPYVEKAQPYLDQANERVYKPGQAAYQQYAAPRVADAQKYSQQQWEKTIKPQLEGAKKQAGKQYDASLAPHVKKVQDVVQPYYNQVRTSASDIWELEIQPVYRNTAPYAQKVYDQGQVFAVKAALPQAQYAGNTAWTFVARQVWPRIRVLYGENVEPQLNRITERLGRYRDGKRLEAEIKSMESESKASEAKSSVESVASSVSSSAKDTATTSSSTMEPESTISPTEQFQEDLKSWEAISAKAVKEGAEDLKERVQDISTHQKSSQAEGVGDSLAVQLEETAVGVVNSVKARIQSVVTDLPEDASDAQLEQTSEDVVIGIRAAGQNVKGRAQAVREWHDNYKNEIDSLVEKALQSTLETVDGIRELRLSEIGRRYADKDLPHKEWSKYNDLKKATQSWRDEVEKVTKEHESIKLAKAAGEDIENRGMSVAEDTAKELARLKDVAKWKIAAGDASDDFETKAVPPVAERAGQQVVEKAEEVKEGVMGSEQGTAESATSVASEQAASLANSASASAKSASDKVSESVAGSERNAGESAASEAKESAQSAASQASEAVDPESSLTDTATDMASDATEAVAGSQKGPAESISASLSVMIEENVGSQSLGPKASSILSAGKAKKEAASDSASSAASEASRAASSVADDASSSVSSASSDASDSASSVASSASSTATEASKKVFAGANAQVLVEAREPILDDVVDHTESYSERIQSLLKDKSNAMTQAVEDALYQVTSTQGTMESITSVASEQYESALAAASSALFGEEKGAVEEGSEAARQQYLSAVTA